MKNSFVMYTDYMQHLELMSMEQRGVFLTAIMQYVSGAELPEMDGMVRMAFSFAKAQIERDDLNYQRVIAARSEAGKQGGRPKTNAFSEKQSKAKKANAFSEKQSKAKKADTVNDTDTVTDTDKTLKTSCPEPETAPARIAASFALNDGSMYNVTENDVAQYQQLYPGIDCMQEIRKIVGWCDANPKNRKTRSGAKRFLNSWLSRAQDSARPAKPTPAPNRFHNFEQRDTDYDAIALQGVRERLKEGNNGSIG